MAKKVTLALCTLRRYWGLNYNLVLMHSGHTCKYEAHTHLGFRATLSQTAVGGKMRVARHKEEGKKQVLFFC